MRPESPSTKVTRNLFTRTEALEKENEHLKLENARLANTLQKVKTSEYELQLEVRELKAKLARHMGLPTYG